MLGVIVTHWNLYTYGGTFIWLIVRLLSIFAVNNSYEIDKDNKRRLKTHK